MRFATAGDSCLICRLLWSSRAGRELCSPTCQAPLPMKTVLRGRSGGPSFKRTPGRKKASSQPPQTLAMNSFTGYVRARFQSLPAPQHALLSRLPNKLGRSPAQLQPPRLVFRPPQNARPRKHLHAAPALETRAGRGRGWGGLRSLPN